MMRVAIPLLAILVIASGPSFGQSLAEVAKKEKNRREKNKEEGKEVKVLSEHDLPSSTGEAPAESGSSEGAAPSTESSTGTSSSSAPTAYVEEGSEGEVVPAFIPPDAPLAEKLELYERMKRQYQRQAQEIDEAIAKNDARLKEIEAELGATSALGGAGLPVAPQTGTGAAMRPMTGQESASLTAEQTRLQEANAQLRKRKEELKTNVEVKGRAAGIPAGYLRF
jgi:hypothetical protein